MERQPCSTEDDLSRTSVASDSSAPDVSSSGATSRDVNQYQYRDLAKFVELVGVYSDQLHTGDDSEAWSQVYVKGMEYGCDWAQEDHREGRQLWKWLVDGAQTHRSSPLIVGRRGMKQETYDEFVDYLKSGAIPGRVKNVTDFRRKCESYSFHSNGMLMYFSRGSRKYVLLEGEVEKVIQEIHLRLGHAPHSLVRVVVEPHFYADCNVSVLCKTLLRCNTEEYIMITQDEVRASVSCQAERILGCLSLKMVVHGVVRECSLLPCSREMDESCVSSSCSASSVFGMNQDYYNEIVCFLRSGKVPDRIKDKCQFRKDVTSRYKWTSQGLIHIRSHTIVLGGTEAFDLILTVHNMYGHSSAKKLAPIFASRFHCPGLSIALQSLRNTCDFCVMRSDGRITSTSTDYEDFTQNAKFDVSVDWVGEERKIRIIPVGLNQLAIEQYVERIINKCGGLPKRKDVDTNETADPCASLYPEVISVVNTMARKAHIGSPPNAALGVDTPLNSESDIENRCPQYSRPRFANKRKAAGANTELARIRSALSKKKAHSRATVRVRWAQDKLVHEFDASEPSSQSAFGGEVAQVRIPINFPDDSAPVEALWSDEEECELPGKLSSPIDTCSDSELFSPPSSPVDSFVLDEEGDRDVDDVMLSGEQEEVGDTACETGPRAWQWSDMRPDEVYAFQEQMVLQDMHNVQLEQSRLHKEVVELELDAAYVNLVDKLQNTVGDAASQSAFCQRGSAVDVPLRSVSVDAAITDSKYSGDANPDYPSYADPYLFETSVTSNQPSASHLTRGTHMNVSPSSLMSNPFDIATCRRPSGYNECNGMMIPLNPGPIRNPYADLGPEPSVPLMSEAPMSPANNDWNDYYRQNRNGLYGADAPIPIPTYVVDYPLNYTVPPPADDQENLASDVAEAMQSVL